MTTPLPTGIAPQTLETRLRDALQTLARIERSLAGRYPDDTTANGRLRLRAPADGLGMGENSGWTTSFLAGMDWLGWEVSADEELHAHARRPAHDFGRRVRAREGLQTHDLGFLYTLSCVPAWRFDHDDDARAAAVLAADALMLRFLEPAGIIQAWGDLSDPLQRGRTIVDSLMNMPLLHWASDVTGDERYRAAATRHTEQVRRHMLRDDDSTFHTFWWDATTGEPVRGGTEQGAGDDSCWARGQTWGIYGFALAYRELGDPALLDAARRCASYFLEHLPGDLVPYWDLVYAEGSDAPRDSSSAAIAACGMLELAALEPEDGAAWRVHASSLVGALIEHCVPDRPEDADALLLHGVYDAPKAVGVDEGTLWGDYFYLEALVRLRSADWHPYWHADAR